MNVYVGKAAQVDDDENEIFHKTVYEMNLSLLYPCENFQDVVDLAMKQNQMSPQLK